MTADVLEINPLKPERKKINYASSVLKRGGMVIFPTDTVYGIGVCANKKDGIKDIYRVKKRSKAKSIIVLICHKQDVNKFAAHVPEGTKKLMKTFWPGALTIVFKAKNNKKYGIMSDTIGIRMPANKIALSLIRKTGPLATSSANISGEQSVNSAGALSARLKRRVNMIINGGKSLYGRESTIIDATTQTFRVLREGAIKKEELSAFAEAPPTPPISRG